MEYARMIDSQMEDSQMEDSQMEDLASSMEDLTTSSDQDLELTIVYGNNSLMDAKKRQKSEYIWSKKYITDLMCRTDDFGLLLQSWYYYKGTYFSYKFTKDYAKTVNICQALIKKGYEVRTCANHIWHVYIELDDYKRALPYLKLDNGIEANAVMLRKKTF